MTDPSLRDQISAVVTEALRALPDVLAGWQGGSAAFGTLDAYSDIDLNYLVTDEARVDSFYRVAESARDDLSHHRRSHGAAGPVHKLHDGGEFLFVDICFLQVGVADQFLEVERHGDVRSLFDKGDWLRPKPLDEAALAIKRQERFRELQTWFLPSQSFVRKAILRRQPVEAVSAFWGYTMKPLAELLRMRYCPTRWDFGLRYLDRDLPIAVYEQVQDLAVVQSLEDLEAKLGTATTWGAALLDLLGRSVES